MIVKGRAFAMSEPGWKHDWPVLTCIDTESGKQLWEREINHLAVTGLDQAKQDEVAKKWSEFQATWRKLYTTFAETVGQGDQEAAKTQLKEMGYDYRGHSGGGYGQLRSLKPKPQCTIKEAGLRQDVWRHDCGLGHDEIGSAFATPVSDGKHVYVVASRSAAASYDFDGNLRWMQFMPPPPELGKYIESNGRSPILYKGLMITDHPGYTIAFDKATGRVKWQVKTFGGGIATPAIITVAGTDILLTEGHQGKGGGIHAIRLPDGQHLKLAQGKKDKGDVLVLDDLLSGSEDTGESVMPKAALPKAGGWGPGGNAMMVNTDHRDVAYFSSGCHTDFQGSAPDSPDQPLWTKLPAAVRFALEGDTLKATVLWDGTKFQGKAPAHIPMVYHGGKLYIGDVVLDALSGEVLAGGRGPQQVLPRTRHLLLLALDPATNGGGCFYGLDGFARLCDAPPPVDKPAATLSCYSLQGKQLGTSPLFMAPVDEEKLAQTRSQVGWDRWGFGYGMPFTVAGDCLYLRSSDELVCVGNK